MSMKSEEDCFEPDMEEEFTEEVEEEVEEDTLEQRSEGSEKAKSKSGSDAPVKNQGNTVDRYFWVDNIKPGTKTDKVQDLFKKYGKVLAVKVIRGGSDGNLLAFIKFDTPQDAQKCLDNLDNTEFQGNTIKILRERPNAPEDTKPDKRPVKRNFSPKRSFSPRRYQNRNGGGGGDRPFRGSGGGFQGGRRGDLRSGGGFRDGGFQDHRGGGGRSSFVGGGERFERFDRFARDRDDDRRTREFEMRREKEFFELEKERLEVERLKLKREREELEKLSVDMSYDRFDKRQKTFNDSFDSSRRFDDFRRDELKRSDRFSPERDTRAPISRFTSGSSLGASMPTARPPPSFSSSGGRDRGYEQQKSWQSSTWDSHEPAPQQSGRSSWQSSSNFASNSSSSHNDRGRYNNGSSSSGMASGQRISSSGNDRGFGSSFGGSSSGHRRY